MHTHIILIDARWQMYLTSSLLSAMQVQRSRHHGLIVQTSSCSRAQSLLGLVALWPQDLGWRASSWRRSACQDRSWGHLWSLGGESCQNQFPSLASRHFCRWEEDTAQGNCALRLISAFPFAGEPLGNWRVDVYFAPCLLLPQSSCTWHHPFMV